MAEEETTNQCEYLSCQPQRGGKSVYIRRGGGTEKASEKSGCLYHAQQE